MSHMTRKEMVRVAARQLVAEHAIDSAKPPDHKVYMKHWSEAIQILNLTPDEARAYNEVFEDAWKDELDWLWSRYITAQPHVGPRLRQLHQEADMTPNDVARAIGISRQYVYKVYAEDANPTADMVAQLLNASGNTWADLDYPNRRRVK